MNERREKRREERRSSARQEKENGGMVWYGASKYIYMYQHNMITSGWRCRYR